MNYYYGIEIRLIPNATVSSPLSQTEDSSTCCIDANRQTGIGAIEDDL